MKILIALATGWILSFGAVPVSAEEELSVEGPSLSQVVIQLQEGGYRVLRAQEILSSDLEGLGQVIEYYVRVLEPNEMLVLDRVCPPEACPGVWGLQEEFESR